MKIAFHTLGCKVNQYETQAMRRMMENIGFETYDFSAVDLDDVDITVINSCTVTAESDRKLRQLLRRCRRQFPDRMIVLTGCMPQAFPKIAETFEEADIILGNAARRALPERICSYLTNRRRIIDISPHEKVFEPLEIDSFAGRTRAFVKIQDGCNRFCSYCIIPNARGRVRSRSLEDIKLELNKLAEKGYKEVVLVGINLTAYGQDNDMTIADAVDAACSVEGLQRIRLGSLEPDFMNDSVLKRLAAQPKLCPQFHVALQSGCDTTLRRMNRHYTTAEFAALCEKLRNLFPHCALTTDVMVGFPGESEEEFKQSLDFVRRIEFARVHVFAYSRRPGTVADKMPEQLTNTVKNDRSRQMINACRESAISYTRTYIGKTVPVLLETVNPDKTIDGHTDTYLTVRVKTTHNSGDIVNVKITSLGDNILFGEEIV